MIRIWVLGAMALTMTTGFALSQPSAQGGVIGPQSPGTGGPSVMTPGGPALVTGTSGAAQTIMIPGSPVGGSLMNNGNGTSTLLVPGAVPSVVPTPR